MFKPFTDERWQRIKPYQLNLLTIADRIRMIADVRSKHSQIEKPPVFEIVQTTGGFSIDEYFNCRLSISSIDDYMLTIKQRHNRKSKKSNKS